MVPFQGDSDSVIVVHENITERKDAENAMQRLSQIDALTGLAYRRHFLMLAEQELSRVVRYGGLLSLLMIDIDHFKRVNDTYGHQIGDLALQKLGSVFRETLRDIDVVGRLGGEEFTVVLPQTDSETATDVAERIRRTLDTTEIPLERRLPLHLTLS